MRSGGRLMAQQQVYEAEGTPKQLAEGIRRLPEGRKYKITVQFAEGQLPVEEEPVERLDAAITRLTSRTPEEIASIRQRILAANPLPRELPEGQTILDTIMGKWPGEETDEQIREALEKLS